MSTQAQKLAELYDSRNAHEKRISKIEIEVDGNGNPERGLMRRVAVVEESVDIIADQYVSKDELEDHEVKMANQIAEQVSAQVQAARDKKSIARTRTVEAVVIALITAGATVIVKLVGG